MLTAAHCIVNDSYLSTLYDTMVVLHPKVDLGEGVKVVKAFHHAAYTPSHIKSPENNPMNDLGLLVLAEEPESGQPALINQNALKVDTPLTVAGFGVTRSREQDNTGRLRKASIKVTSVAERGKIFWGSGQSRRSGDGPISQGACAGDSGGPVFLQKKQSLVLSGVTSFGEETINSSGTRTYCIGSNGYVDVASYYSVIRDAVLRIELERYPDSQAWSAVAVR